MKYKNIANKYNSSQWTFINLKMEWTSNNFTGEDTTPKLIDADGIYIQANVHLIGGGLKSVSGYWPYSRFISLKKFSRRTNNH